MRNWLDLFEDDDFDHEEEDRLSAVYSRERHVTAIILAACQKAGIDALPSNRPVLYDEDGNRSATIRIDGSVSLEQLEALKPLGSNFTISANSGTGYGVHVEFNVSPQLDPVPKLKR